MRKITLSVALLLFGGGYFANAQVGIGTPTPASSSMLDIVASDKGVLIPRVELTSTAVFAPVTGTEVESLLVYNTETANDVTPGFYYWFATKWNRVINADDLDSANGPKEGDVIYKNIGVAPVVEWAFQYWDGTKYTTITFEEIVQANESKTTILEVDGKFYYISEETIQANGGVPTTPFGADGTTLLAGVIYLDVPASVIQNFETILEGTTTIEIDNTGTFYTVEEYIKYIASIVDGNVIYKNIAAAGDPADFVFQYWNGTTYTTINLGDLVAANETKTFIKEVVLANGNTQYVYFSEKTIQDWLAASTSNTVANIPDNAPGVVVIDATSDVVQNFESILNQTTQYNGGTVTIEEIINEIAGKIDGNVIYKNIGDATTPNWVFQYWDGTTYQTINLGDLVAGLETKTQIKRSEVAVDGTLPVFADSRTAPVAASVKKGEIFYEYNSEDNTDFINITADMISSITNNEEVQNAISNILNLGGNVYYTKGAIAADTATGQVAIPANSLFIIEVVGGHEVKTPIDISGTVLQVITNNAGDIKNILGDEINTTTVVKTGDTFNGGDVYIYTNKTTIAANSAVTTGITIPAGTVPGTIIGIKVINANGISSNVTDVVVTGQTIAFNIGTGNMYNILEAGTYDVIVEFTE